MLATNAGNADTEESCPLPSTLGMEMVLGDLAFTAPDDDGVSLGEIDEDPLRAPGR